MVARIHGKFGGRWNSSTRRFSRQFFSWIFFRADYKETWGFGWTQCSCSFPIKTGIERSVNGPNYKGPMQKTQWRSRTSSRKFWWLDNSISQGLKRQSRISKQSSICSRGAGSSHSKRFRAKTKLHKKPREAYKSSWNPIGILKSFTLTTCEDIFEPLDVYTTLIGD